MSNPPAVSLDTILHVRDHCLCFRARRAARALARRFDLAFLPLDLTNGQFSLLMALNQPRPPRIGRLARFLGMDRTSLTAALKPLQRRGLLDVLPDPEDRRGKVLRITPAGRALLARAMPIWDKTHDEVAQHMGGDDVGALRQMLDTLASLPPG